ncbi:peptidoglycan-binding protein [Streptomyces sp. GQFP]|uniref:peptidoglycan-binding protein n=1 Tax=Streptomyces sp. GQFP TaxID=2907545 RepID=UPI001F4351AB|nr:peptidoglycan-binding protein [Streptomyces sp. GQFP]UIX31800.1 helix-turn-helix domain-containing protein [Streptomyces sp. GQFP]
MPRWKELPAELDPRVHQLVMRLRRLKDRSGLSMRQLAAKTGYSAKSWDRYLNGRSLPPGEAVEAMARTCGDDATRLLALHEVATEAWSSRLAGAPAQETPEPQETQEAQEAQEARETLEQEPRPQDGPRRTTLVAGAVALVLIASASVIAVVQLRDGDGGATASPRTSPTTSSSASASASVSASASPITYTCRIQRIDGRWYSGNSRTQDTILAAGQAGPEVAEAQCLLRRAGIPAGEIDGIFGPLTQRAVERIQKRDELVVDGIIGPHTWGALRRDTGATAK